MPTRPLILIVALSCSGCSDTISMPELGVVGQAPRGWSLLGPLEGGCANVTHEVTRAGVLVCRSTGPNTKGPKTLEEEWAMVKPLYEPTDWTPETLPDGHLVLYRPTTEGMGDEAGWRFESTRTIDDVEYSCDGWASDRAEADQAVAFCKSLKPH